MAVTNHDALASHMRSHAQQGTTKSPVELSQNPGDWYYEQHSVGFNYRMTELQAAFGLSQLSRLDEFIEQ
ncbi:DegT/DnrJ/EryC1/StrS family aminotransferase, partial [Marinomonas arenicola]